MLEKFTSGDSKLIGLNKINMQYLLYDLLNTWHVDRGSSNYDQCRYSGIQTEGASIAANRCFDQRRSADTLEAWEKKT